MENEESIAERTERDSLSPVQGNEDTQDTIVGEPEEQHPETPTVSAEDSVTDVIASDISPSVPNCPSPPDVPMVTDTMDTNTTITISPDVDLTPPVPQTSVMDSVPDSPEREPVYGDDPRIDAMQVSDFAKHLKMECLQRLPKIILKQLDLGALTSVDLTKVDIATCLRAATTATVCFNRQPYPKSTMTKRKESGGPGRRGRKPGRKRGRPRINHPKVIAPVEEEEEEDEVAIDNEVVPSEEGQGPSDPSPEPKKFPCLKCERSFARKVSLNHHVFTKHGTHSMVQCTHCHKWLLDECSLASHTKYVHTPATKPKAGDPEKAEGMPRGFCDDEFRSDPDVCLPFSPSSNDPLMCSKCGRPISMDTSSYGVSKEALTCHCKLFPEQFSDLKNVMSNGPLPLNSPLHDTDLHLSTVEPPTKGSTGSKSLSLSHFSEDNSDSEKGSLIELTNFKNFPLPSPTLRSATNLVSHEFNNHSNDYMDIMRQTSYGSSTGDYWDSMDLKSGPAQTSSLFASLEPVRVPTHDPFGPPQPLRNSVTHAQKDETSSHWTQNLSQDLKSADQDSLKHTVTESKLLGPLDQDIPVADKLSGNLKSLSEDVPASSRFEAPTCQASESADVGDSEHIETPAAPGPKKSKKSSKSKRHKKKDKKKSKKEKVSLVEPRVVLEKCTLKFTGIHGVQETITVDTKKTQLCENEEMAIGTSGNALQKDEVPEVDEQKLPDLPATSNSKNLEDSTAEPPFSDAKTPEPPDEVEKSDQDDTGNLEVDENAESDKHAEDTKMLEEAQLKESQAVAEAKRQEELKAAEAEAKRQEHLKAEEARKREEATKAAEAEAKRQEAIKAAEAEAKRLAAEAKIREAKLAAEAEERKKRERERAKQLEEEHARLLREAEAKMLEAAKIKEKLAKEEEERNFEEEQIRDLEAQTGIKIQVIRPNPQLTEPPAMLLPTQPPASSLAKQPIAVVMPTMTVAPSQPVVYPPQQAGLYNSSVFPTSPYLQPGAPAQPPLLSPQPQTSTNLLSPTQCTMLSQSPLMSPTQMPMYPPTTPLPTVPHNPAAQVPTQPQLASPQNPQMLQIPPQGMLQSATMPSPLPQAPSQAVPPMVMPQTLTKPQQQQNMMIQQNLYQQQSSLPDGYPEVSVEPNSGRSSPENFGSDLDDLIIFHNDFSLPKSRNAEDGSAEVDAPKPKKKKKSKKKKKDRDEEAPEPVPEPIDESLLCQVCGAVAKVGDYYGARICSSCKIFFSSTVKSGHDASYACANSVDEMCIIRPNNRKNCMYCRFQKCVKLGLLRDAVTEETAALEERANKRKRKSSNATKPSPNPNTEEAEGAEKPAPAKKKKPASKKKPTECLTEEDAPEAPPTPQPTPPVVSQEPVYPPMYTTLPAPGTMMQQPCTVSYPAGQMYAPPGTVMAPPPPGTRYVSYGSSYVCVPATSQMMPQPTYLDSSGMPIKMAPVPVTMPMYMQNPAGQVVQVAPGAEQVVTAPTVTAVPPQVVTTPQITTPTSTSAV